MLLTTIKWLLFPGMNLHARLRYTRLPSYFHATGPSEGRFVLDAGCGNGMLGYRSYLKENRVVGISIKEREVEGCRQLFNSYLGISEDRLSFRMANLYEIDFDSESFDEIICSEVLEHLRDDLGVCRKFWKILKPGGFLHICAPNAQHPYNATFTLDREEKGGHVRPGYTLDSYRNLLEPLGFKILAHEGLGGPIRQAFNRRIKEVQARSGTVAGLPLFLLALPCLWFENRRIEQEIPFSIYVKAVKPALPR